MVTGVAPALAQGPDCVGLEVDGRRRAGGGGAPRRAGRGRVDPGRRRLGGNPGPARLAAPPAAGAGTVLAESPFYLVTDAATAKRVADAGGGWLGLADLVTGDGPDPVRLAVRDPGGSGDGMLGAGAVAEAVWVKSGMDASAEALADGAAAHPHGRRREPPRCPEAPGEVGLVPEYGLLPVAGAGPRRGVGGAGPARPHRGPALQLAAHRGGRRGPGPGRGAGAAVRRAHRTGGRRAAGTRPGLRRPGGGPPPGADGLPATSAPLFDVLGPHHVDHVLASWYAADRRSDLLVAVDVSGSMGARAPGSDRALIDIVRDGVGELASLLPDDSQLTLWRFGTQLDGERDYEPVLRATTLDGEGRAAVSRAVGQLVPQGHGTGLHDTILAAYEAARDAARPDVPSHVVVFTDGRNEADAAHAEPRAARAAAGGGEGPAAARRAHRRRVRRGRPEARRSRRRSSRSDGYLDALRTADEVKAAFIHAAAGGIHE